MRNYYKSCMDTDLIEEKSVSDLKEIISRLGGWPVVEGRYGRGIFRNDDRFNDLSFRGMQRSVLLTVSALFSLITPTKCLSLFSYVKLFGRIGDFVTLFFSKFGKNFPFYNTTSLIFCFMFFLNKVLSLAVSQLKNSDYSSS